MRTCGGERKRKKNYSDFISGERRKTWEDLNKLRVEGEGKRKGKGKRGDAPAPESHFTICVDGGEFWEKFRKRGRAVAGATRRKKKREKEGQFAVIN